MTLSDRLRPPGIGFGVGWIHVYPPSISADQLALAERVAVDSVRALGLRDGIAFPQLIAAPDGRVAVVEVAARIPGGQMADLVRHAVGVDLVEVALRQALGEKVADEVALPRFSQPLAIRFFTAEPGPLPTGRVTRIGSLEPVLAADGVVQAETYLQVGETIRPVRLDGDRRGYVIAVGRHPRRGARPRRGGGGAPAPWRWLRVSCSFDLRALRGDPRGGEGRRLPLRRVRRGPEPGDLFLRHDIDLSLDAALRDGGARGASSGVHATYLLMTESVFYNLASQEGVAAIDAAARARPRVGLHAVYPNAELDERFDPVVAWHNPQVRVHVRRPIAGAINVYGERVLRPADIPLGLESALALGLSSRGAAGGRVPVAADPRPSRDLGVSGSDDGGDDAGDARGGEGTPIRAARRRRHRPCLSARSVSSTARSTPRASRGRTSRRSDAAASTRSSSSSTATSSTPEADWSLERSGGFFAGS